MADGCGEEATAQKNQDWGYYEAKWWADEEIQRQLSAMARNQNIWENIAAKLNDRCEYKQHKLYNHVWNVFETDIWYEQCNDKHV